MRILLVEDEPDLGAAIQSILLTEKYVVDWTLNGTEAWDYLEDERLEYTIAIFDWLLPGLTGIELCQKLRYRKNPLPVLMLTARDRLEDKITGLDAGADDYLVKPFLMKELLARIRALQRRSLQIQPQQLQVGQLVLDYATSNVFIDKKVVPLTAKEFQILEYFLRHPGQILSRDQLMDRLWELQAEPMSNVVAAHMRLLRRKLEQYQCENLIETVYGLGYRLNIPDATE